MRVEPVDERDSSWEDPQPRFRVYFFAGDGPGHDTWTYDITDADAVQVMRWAQSEAGADRMFAVALVRDAILAEGRPRQRGLVWLLGMDANDVVTTEAAQFCQAAMRRRRGRNLVVADDE
jgi:hypothetical protein